MLTDHPIRILLKSIDIQQPMAESTRTPNLQTRSLARMTKLILAFVPASTLRPRVALQDPLRFLQSLENRQVESSPRLDIIIHMNIKRTECLEAILITPNSISHSLDPPQTPEPIQVMEAIINEIPVVINICPAILLTMKGLQETTGLFLKSSNAPEITTASTSRSIHRRKALSVWWQAPLTLVLPSWAGKECWILLIDLKWKSSKKVFQQLKKIPVSLILINGRLRTVWKLQIHVKLLKRLSAFSLGTCLYRTR